MNETTIPRPDGARLRVLDHGGGALGTPAIVLSNSLATDAALWDAVVPHLQEYLRVVAYDTRGHGASRAPAPAATLATLADDLFAVMDAVGLERAFVAGISLGGMTALECALRVPARVLGVAACNCRASIDATGIAGWDERLQVLKTRGLADLATLTLERWFAPGYRAAHADRMALVASMIRRTSPVGYEACVRAIQSVDLQSRLGRFAVPALLVAGAQDGAASPAAMQAVAQAIPNARFEVLDPCGHLSAIQQPDALAHLIVEFCRAHGADT